MGPSNFLRFLIDSDTDPDLRAALRRASVHLLSVNELAAFARRQGYAFDPCDVPLEAAQRCPITERAA